MRHVVASLLVLSFASRVLADGVTPGAPMRTVKGVGGCSYALYVPTGYKPTQKWPLLVCFHPGAHGYNFVVQCKDACEAQGWIIAASNDYTSHDPALAKSECMRIDLAARLAIHPGRLYTGGYSGGSRPAIALATAWGARGMIAVGGTCTQAGDIPLLPLFMAVSPDDGAREEMEGAKTTLAEKGIAVELVVFEGKSTFPPKATFAAAFAWHERRWKDRAPGELADGIKQLDGLTDAVARYWKIRALIETYEGVEGTRALDPELRKLADDKRVREELLAYAAYQKLERQEGGASAVPAMTALASKLRELAKQHEGKRAAELAIRKAESLEERARETQ